MGQLRQILLLLDQHLDQHFQWSNLFRPDNQAASWLMLLMVNIKYSKFWTLKIRCSNVWRLEISPESVMVKH